MAMNRKPILAMLLGWLPADSRRPNSNYTATVAFYHVVGVSNATCVMPAYRATGTDTRPATGRGMAYRVRNGT